MAKKPALTPSNRAYIEHFLAHVETNRTQSCGATDVERILADMGSEDEKIRADAIRQICPCRMDWEVFEQLRKAAKALRQDPSPLVRANAIHIEEDARMVASFEATMAQIKEQEDEEQKPRKRDKPWRKR